MNAWDYLDKDGRFRKYDWVVKVDPDAVFFPSRLRSNLAALVKPGTHPNLYFVNCKISFGLFGAIEVFSRRALDTYLKGQLNCKTGLDWTMMGEDLWMKKCFDFLGVEHQDDFELLMDGYCNEPPNPCVSGKVAFHAFKTPMQYMQCVDEARKAQPEDPRAVKMHAVPTQLPATPLATTTTEPPVHIPEMLPGQSEEDFMRNVILGEGGRVDAEIPSAEAYRIAVQDFVKTGADGMRLPTQEAPTTPAPTTMAPTTRAPTTMAPTTPASTTISKPKVVVASTEPHSPTFLAQEQKEAAPTTTEVSDGALALR